MGNKAKQKKNQPVKFAGNSFFSTVDFHMQVSLL